MIKANELRKDNWVKTKQGFGKVGTISEGQGGGFEGVVSNDNDSVWARIPYDGDIDGIPLTPEILKHVGFTTRQDGIWKNRRFVNGRFVLTLYKNGRCMFCVMAADNVRIADIYFVHQLQNLYFALTGEELEVKELKKV